MFKDRLILEELGLVEGLLAMAGGWKQMTFRVFSNPNHSVFFDQKKI